MFSKRTWLVFILLAVLSTGNGVFAQNELTKVACIGNSVTYGYGLQNRKQDNYPAKLQGLLGNKFEVKNYGHSGATLLKRGHNPYYKTPEFSSVLAFKPNIVIIHLGLNDTDPRTGQITAETLKRTIPGSSIRSGRAIQELEFISAC